MSDLSLANYKSSSVKERRILFENALVEIKKLRKEKYVWLVFEEDIRIHSGAGKTLRKDLPMFIRALRDKADAQ